MTWRGFLIILGIATLAPLAQASEAGSGPVPFERAYTNLQNEAALQRGAKYFVNYCLSCHTAKYMRYTRLHEDLGLTAEQVQENLMFAADKIYEPMNVAMRDADQTVWFGNPVPDLSLVARSRGVDWIYNYLKGFYLDPSQPLGWNNAVLPQAAMPNPLWELQGVQAPVYETATNEAGVKEKKLVGISKVHEGQLSQEEFNQVVRDIATFLEYMGEPAKMKRESMGIWVLIFIALFTFVTWLLKREYWRDVH